MFYVVMSVSQVWPVNDQKSERRFNKLERWYHFGGVALMGYDMFRNMAMGKRVRVKRKREAYKQFLLDPGQCRDPMQL